MYIPPFFSHLVSFPRTWMYLEVRFSWGWCEWIHEHRRAPLFFHMERYLPLSLAYSSGAQRAISGMLLSFLYLEICVIDAISCCSTSVQYVCFSGHFSNVLCVVFLLLARGKDVSCQCLGLKTESLLSWLHVWRLDRSNRLNSIAEDCKVSSLLGELSFPLMVTIESDILDHESPNRTTYLPVRTCCFHSRVAIASDAD